LTAVLVLALTLAGFPAGSFPRRAAKSLRIYWIDVEAARRRSW